MARGSRSWPSIIRSAIFCSVTITSGSSSMGIPKASAARARAVLASARPRKSGVMGLPSLDGMRI
eukprot:scaffold49926_cov55-Phaeocystis_antarctica.AAC.5